MKRKKRYTSYAQPPVKELTLIQFVSVASEGNIISLQKLTQCHSNSDIPIAIGYTAKGFKLKVCESSKERYLNRWEWLNELKIWNDARQGPMSLGCK